MSNDTKTRRVYGKTAYNLQKKLLDRIQDIYMRAGIYHLTHSKIGELMLEVWNDAKRLGAAENEYLRGYAQARSDEVWRRDLVWVMSCDGKLLTREEVDELTKVEDLSGENGKKGYMSPWQRIDNDKSVHVWKGEDGKPLKDKPFSTIKSTDQSN